MAFSFGSNLNLGTSTNNNTTKPSLLYGHDLSQRLTQLTIHSGNNTLQTSTANTATQNAPAFGGSTTNTSGPQIDIAHLRSTTKWDHLTPQLQQEIEALDTAILNQIRQSTEVADLIPTVVNAGSQIAAGIEFVSSKLDELETGLENDAEAIVNVRDGTLKKDESEAKCVFRAVDRLRMPRQYQVGHTADASASGGAAFGGVGNGLSGWWNHPQTMRGSVRSTGAGGQIVQLVEEGTDDEPGPKTLVALFEERSQEMADLSQRHNRLLTEIEDFVEGLETKVINKERNVSERIELGDRATIEDEKAQQMQLLQYVFGEVQRSLYDVAEKIGNTRDGVVDLSVQI